MGMCVSNALNVKRGYWRMTPNNSTSTGISPFGSTPDSIPGSGRVRHSNSVSSISAGIRTESDSPSYPASATNGNPNSYLATNAANQKDATQLGSAHWFIPTSGDSQTNATAGASPSQPPQLQPPQLQPKQTSEDHDASILSAFVSGHGKDAGEEIPPNDQGFRCALR
jgi:hypothetical protein